MASSFFLLPGRVHARPLQRALRIDMWENCGVVRDKTSLLLGREILEEIKASSKFVDVRPDAMGFLDLAIALDLRGSIVAAEATLRSALAREESRGAHQRKDFPKLNKEFNINIQIQLEGERQSLHLEPVKAVPDYLGSWIEDTSEISIVGRLLE